ncbi:hypothetical protein N0V82_008591 [Gnomoniopsis sp. IMI 355080]|nr:hypothetical protein N0V82_008591 [Gnomoniopsis sp. IMI 355080]
MSASFPRSHIKGETHPYISPVKEINVGIWSLFIGATLFLGLRLWCKISRRYGMWYDDYILIASWLILFINDIIISVEYATGYVADDWDDRMRILINITSTGTIIGQALTKSAFGISLLRISNRYLQWVLWFCIVTMNMYMLLKVILQWGKICGSKVYDVWYRFDFCITDDVRDQVKKGGNVYNLLMDFVFAIFPWIITWRLRMERAEKYSLCATLSLGMIIAISTAVRTYWKDDDVEHDECYFWNNAMSQIWFSSEICGTIIVQCIPILRPFLKEVTTTFPSASKRSRQSSFVKSTKERASYGSAIPLKDRILTDRSPNERDPETDSDTFIFGVAERSMPEDSQPHSGKDNDAWKMFSPQPSPRHAPSNEPVARPWSSGC